MMAGPRQRSGDDQKGSATLFSSPRYQSDCVIMSHQNAHESRNEERVSQVSQAGEKGAADTFRNLSTQSSAASAKLIMMDSIRMNRDWVRIAVSEIHSF